MMRRPVLTLVLVAFAGRAMAAQMPPSISKPIDAARKAANATNEQQAKAMQQVAPSAASPAKPAVKPTAPAQAKPPAAPAKERQAVAAGKAPAAVQDTNTITFDREVFAYMQAGRRDPFASPIETGEIRPLIADLKVTGIIFDARGTNSVAVMRDMSTQQQYRVKTGHLLGRAKVSQIKPQEVVMTIDEYGLVRQEILKLSLPQSQQNKGKP